MQLIITYAYVYAFLDVILGVTEGTTKMLVGGDKEFDGDKQINRYGETSFVGCFNLIF